MRGYNCEILKILGDRLKYFREQNNLSREQVAARIGVSARTLASYERGEREASGEMIIKIADLYGVTFTKLTDYKNIMQNIVQRSQEGTEGVD